MALASGRTAGGNEGLARLVEHLIGAGVHGLTPLGSTGEFACLAFEQKRRIVAVTVETAAGRSFRPC